MTNTIDDFQSGAVELASLVAKYLTPSRYKSLGSYTSRHLVYAIKQGEEIHTDEVNTLLSQTSLNKKSDQLSLEELLADKHISTDDSHRIQELYANPSIRKLYFSEYKKREEGFQILKQGVPGIRKIKKIDRLIDQARDTILDMRVQAFKENRQLTPSEVSRIDLISKAMAKKTQEKEELLNGRETATAYRLQELKTYKHQFDTTGFVITPSRQHLIDEIIEKILLGQNVLLTGPTGTGKTVLAVQAVKTIASKLNMPVENLSGKSLADELSQPSTSKQIDDFVEVISGHAGITPSEFIAKMTLQNGNTVTQLGKLLKAFVNGTIPIIDEIDLIPNDVLMRIKHLFTLKPGKEYAPQEDSHARHTLKITNLIATANIKSDKHPDRQDIDPAIVRLFEGVGVGYLPQEETYDLALANLIEKEGFIYKVGIQNLSDPSGVLVHLISALKQIEDSYLGKGTGLEISNKKKLFLQKAVLELGKFVNMFKGFKESGKDFASFIKQKIIEFVCNGAYPMMDRLMLIKIFSSKGLLTKQDIPAMLSRSDISQADLDTNIIASDHRFPVDDITFVDPYGLANLDPYGQRKLETREMENKTSNIIKIFQQIHTTLFSRQDDRYEPLLTILDTILDGYTQDTSYELSQENIQDIVSQLYDLSEIDMLLQLENLGDGFKAIIDKLRIYDNQDIHSKKLFPSVQEQTSNPSHHREHLGEIEQQLKTHILSSNRDRVLRLQKDGVLQIEGGYELQTHLTTKEKKKIPLLQEKDIIIKEKLDREYQGESYQILLLELHGEQYTAIHVPEKIKTMKYKDTHIGKQLETFKDKDRYPAFLAQDGKMESQLDQEWLIVKSVPSTKNADRHININAKAKDPTTTSEDILRECSKQGMGLLSITDCIIQAELIHGRFGADYLSKEFTNQNFDPASTEASQQLLQKKLKEIENEFAISYPVNTKDNKGYLQIDYSIYKQQKPYKVDNKDEYFAGYLRGDFFSDFSALGGVCSVFLYCDLGGSSSRCGFRPCGSL